MMDIFWREMMEAAIKVQNRRTLSPYMEAGGVAAAILTESGKIYTGVNVEACCGLGICAERNAAFAMLTGGENVIKRVLAVMQDGKCGPPCGACRELLMQLSEKNADAEVLLDNETMRVVKLRDLCADWWKMVDPLKK